VLCVFVLSPNEFKVSFEKALENKVEKKKRKLTCFGPTQRSA
jgi:hypothetical protein